VNSAEQPYEEAAGCVGEFIDRHSRLLVITGAGCSTNSGIPAYRGHDGQWKRKPPVQLPEFLRSEQARRRYWARSLLGWPRFATARPNGAHRALAQLEQRGAVRWLITQNVDGLHQRAGSERLTELHGGLAQVVCLRCGERTARAQLQGELIRLNPDWHGRAYRAGPDGDAEPDDEHVERFRVVDCRRCGGLLKPDVVFFGENVPRARLEQALARLAEADAVLVVGSSLMVWSGYRFVRAAAARGLPVLALTRGRTRADAEVSCKVEACCERVLERVAQS
jgi:NAD-dependent SIR2 family protein deacetylase